MKLKHILTNVLYETIFLFRLDPQPHTFDAPYFVLAERSPNNPDLVIPYTIDTLMCATYLRELSPPSYSLYLVFSTTKPKNNLPYFLIQRDAEGHFIYEKYVLYSYSQFPPEHKLPPMYIYNSLMSNLLLFPPSSTIYISLLPR
jgi:hypothetical protein